MKTNEQQPNPNLIEIRECKIISELSDRDFADLIIATYLDDGAHKRYKDIIIAEMRIRGIIDSPETPN